MGRNRCSSQWVGAVVVAAVCLAGCLCPAPTPEAASLHDTPTPSPTLVVPTKVSAFTAVPPSTPTPSPIPPTRTPRPTPAPTMAADEEQALVLGLLRDNGGCRLPCWWGFTPGETRWQEAQSFFLSLGKKIAGGSDDGASSYGVVFDVSQHQLFLRQAYIVDEDEVIDMISVLMVGSPGYEEEFAQDLDSYLLSQLLATYGQPSQVLLRTYLAPDGTYPFHLLLYYPEQGVMVRYIDLAERAGEELHFCPKQPGITLWLWSPERRMTIMDIAATGLEGFPKNEVAYFRPLEEVTELSVEQFYQTFVQPDSETCLETPADLW